MWKPRLLKSVRQSFRRRKVLRIRGVEAGSGLLVQGTPLIDVRNGGRIMLGANVTLNSDNRGYHINMYAPVKLYVDRPGAVIQIGDNTRVHGSCIHAYRGISIGRNCLIAANCQIMDGSGHDLSFDRVENRINTTGTAEPILIEDNVWIGANCIILPGVRIGYGSVIAAGSVVAKSIPPYVIAGGNPAKVIRDARDPRTPGSGGQRGLAQQPPQPPQHPQFPQFPQSPEYPQQPQQPQQPQWYNMPGPDSRAYREPRG